MVDSVFNRNPIGRVKSSMYFKRSPCQGQTLTRNKLRKIQFIAQKPHFSDIVLSDHIIKHQSNYIKKSLKKKILKENHL